MTRGKRVNIHGIIGVTVLIVAQGLMFYRVEPFFSWFYCLAWWSYILIVDSLIYRLKGNSLILSRPREFLLMIPWSFTLWLFFEVVNLAMRNWYYINVPSSGLIRFVGYAAAYGTVLPGIFETTELLETVGLFQNVSTPRIRVTPGWYVAFFIVGGLFLVLPLVLPRYTFPLIWGSLIFLLEPVNHRFGGRSLLAQWEQGSLRKFYILLVSGLICGGLWEFWNFWARTKWVYTVPFFDELKLFEMPLLGFLGFPPFAVECYVIYNFISLFRHERGWEEDVYRLNLETRTSRRLRLITTLCLLLFYVLSTRAVDRYTIDSTLPILDDFSSLSADEKEQLEGLGVYTLDDLFYRARTPEAYKEIHDRLNFPQDRLDELIRKARVIGLKGLGINHFLLLEKAGIDSVEKLAKEEPEGLHRKLLGIETPSPSAKHPTRAQMKIWIMEARRQIR
ncbi:MAG: DUF4332 domain-containing protein [Proteobacteria bacterium]|nr:DUF4332 domain-containing protein [Pseudomonadota bacterium]NIS67624.1 DUF4332 domain-containing protein [Pseudomonadota bacterium]